MTNVYKWLVSPLEEVWSWSCTGGTLKQKISFVSLVDLVGIDFSEWKLAFILKTHCSEQVFLSQLRLIGGRTAVNNAFVMLQRKLSSTLLGSVVGE